MLEKIRWMTIQLYVKCNVFTVCFQLHFLSFWRQNHRYLTMGNMNVQCLYNNYKIECSMSRVWWLVMIDECDWWWLMDDWWWLVSDDCWWVMTGEWWLVMIGDDWWVWLVNLIGECDWWVWLVMIGDDWWVIIGDDWWMIGGDLWVTIDD